VIASTANGRAIFAQSPVIDSAAAPKRALPRDVSVKAGGAQFTVYRQGAKPVRVAVRTDSGTFALSADSATLAKWADSAATLPDPPDTGKGKKVSFKMWQIRAEGDSGAHMRFVRLPANHGPELVLAMFNGAWNGFAYLGAQAPNVLAALRGDATVVPDTALVAGVFWPQQLHGAQCRSGDPTYQVSSGMTDTTCTRSVLEKQAAQHRHSAEPTYPVALQRARIEGEATMQFVIDTTGRVDARTIELLASTDFRFAEACREALPQMQFDPATIDGRKVRELVQLPFTFAMHR
jgi:TonB family protein